MGGKLSNIIRSAAGPAAVGFVVIGLVGACGGDDETGDDTTGGSTTGGPVCVTRSECIGGNCQCTEGPNLGDPCCSPDEPSCDAMVSCKELCEVCE